MANTNTRHPDAPPPPDVILCTVQQFAGQQPALSEGSIRWAIFNAETNGLEESGALIRAGRRVLIDPVRYLAWLRTNPAISPPRKTATKNGLPYRPKPVAILETGGLPA